MARPGNLAAAMLAGAALMASGPQALEPPFTNAHSITRNVIGGTIAGHETVSYVLGLGAGRYLAVNLTASHPALHFDLTAPGETEPVHIGAVAGNSYETAFTQAGEWELAVYFAPHAARRDARARFSLDIMVSDAPPDAE